LPLTQYIIRLSHGLKDELVGASPTITSPVLAYLSRQRRSKPLLVSLKQDEPWKFKQGLMQGLMQVVKGFGVGAIACLIVAMPSPVSAQISGLVSAQTSNQTSNQTTCEFFSAPQRFNTQTNGDVIVIGAQPNRRYHIIVANGDDTVLAGIRTCVLDAFVSQSKLGPYIQVGSFDRRSEAEAIQRILRREGYRTRIIYWR
jgi:hypothetical protein